MATDANICPMKMRWKEHPDLIAPIFSFSSKREYLSKVFRIFAAL